MRPLKQIRRSAIAIAAAFLAGLAASGPLRAEEQGLYLFEQYRPDADPAADLELAKARASAEGKRILVEVGGDWCVWCHILDAYLEANADVEAAYRSAFLAQYPERGGYPHFYVLGADGGLLASQDTVELEDGGESYDHAAMMAFAARWTP
jgi:hypothetical protein